MASRSRPAAQNGLVRRLLPLLIRADADSRMGTGHVMRCLALASAWRAAGGDVVLRSWELPLALRQRALALGVAVSEVAELPGSAEDAAATACLAHRLRSASIVVDGYHFRHEFQAQVPRTLQLVLIDDDGRLPVSRVDLLLNQNLDVDPHWYRERRPDSHSLFGPRYAMLRPEFARSRRAALLIRRHAERILVTLGGADPDNVALRVLQELDSIQRRLKVRVLAGAASRHVAELIAEAGGGRHEVVVVRGCRRVDRQLMWADLVVSAAGSTVWEIACLGTPARLIAMVDNQLGIAQAMERRWPGTVLSGDSSWADDIESLLEDFELRRSLSASWRRCVDGLGAGRIVGVIQEKVCEDRSIARELAVA